MRVHDRAGNGLTRVGARRTGRTASPSVSDSLIIAAVAGRIADHDVEFAGTLQLARGRTTAACVFGLQSPIERRRVDRCEAGRRGSISRDASCAGRRSPAEPAIFRPTVGLFVVEPRARSSSGSAGNLAASCVARVDGPRLGLATMLAVEPAGDVLIARSSWRWRRWSPDSCDERVAHALRLSCTFSAIRRPRHIQRRPRGFGLAASTTSRVVRRGGRTRDRRHDGPERSSSARRTGTAAEPASRSADRGMTWRSSATRAYSTAPSWRRWRCRGVVARCRGASASPQVGDNVGWPLAPAHGRTPARPRGR